MEDENGNEILVTSPKKKNFKMIDGKLVRQLSGDILYCKSDDEDDSYVEEIIDEDTENDSVEEIISSSEEEVEEDSDEDDTDDDVDESVDDDVEIESIDDEDDSGAIDDGTDGSGSEFDPLPPPIRIPDALKPPHLRAKPKPSYDDDDFDEDDISSDDDSDDDLSSDGGFGEQKKKSTPTKKAAAPATKKSQYSYDDDDDVELSSDSDDDDSSLSSSAKVSKNKEKTSIVIEINKDADDYDEDDDKEEEEKLEPPSKEPELKVEREEPAEQATKITDDPTTAIRPISFRGNSFSEDDDLPTAGKRGSKKPSKWQQQPSSVYVQNGVSSVKKSTFTKPTLPEPKPISENRPSEVLGQTDTKPASTSVRGATTAKNEPIKQASPPPTPTKEKPRVQRKAILPTKKEEKEEEDWNTEPKDDGNGPYYSYDELKGKKIPDLDYLNREKYLSPYDFMNLFKVKKSEFETWPKWKQTKAKRKVKLF